MSASDGIRIRFGSYDSKAMGVAMDRVLAKIAGTGVVVSGPIPLPSRKRRITVIRSPHIDKRSMEHFEIKRHRRLVKITRANPVMVEALIGLELPSGVEVERLDTIVGGGS